MDSNLQSMRNKLPMTKFTRDKKLNVLVNSLTDNRKFLMPLLPLKEPNLNLEHALFNNKRLKVP
jgi:hypothetical protein